MRNDARPIGHDAQEEGRSRGPQSRETDGRESVTQDRQSHIVNRGAEEQARRDDADVDPVMPTRDSTLKTRI